MQPDHVPADAVTLPPADGYQLRPDAAPEAIRLALPPAPPPWPAPRPRPVQPQERVAAVDVLRGVALMGILTMNVVMFGWPESVYDSPRVFDGSGPEGSISATNRALWAFNHVVFDEKMMTIFSMLFGAGLVLMSERNEARGASLTRIYYRRVFYLLLIGLYHAYFVWHGDILVLYAECGFLLFLFRRRSPRTLIALGTLCVLLPAVLAVGLTDVAKMAEDNYWRMFAEPPRALSAVARFVNENVNPTAEHEARRFAKDVAAFGGDDYLYMVGHRTPELLAGHTIAFATFLLWMVGGRMLIGMGLMKLDVFSARRSRRFYWTMIAAGYGFGLPLVAYDTWQRIACDFRGIPVLEGKLISGYLSAIPIALGHVGVVMLVYKSGALQWLTRRLAAAGRMALSNYLMQSLVCTTLFYGYGFALYGRIDRLGLAGIVVAVWVFQLTTSIVWLRYFRFGPAEWLWRSLTYWSPQPMLVRAAAVPAAALTSEPVYLATIPADLEAGPDAAPGVHGITDEPTRT